MLPQQYYKEKVHIFNTLFYVGTICAPWWW